MVPILDSVAVHCCGVPPLALVSARGVSYRTFREHALKGMSAELPPRSQEALSFCTSIPSTLGTQAFESLLERQCLTLLHSHSLFPFPAPPKPSTALVPGEIQCPEPHLRPLRRKYLICPRTLGLVFGPNMPGVLIHPFSLLYNDLGGTYKFKQTCPAPG